MQNIEDWTEQIHQGDARDTLAEMPESSVHMSMTSPPYYGLRDYDAEGQIGLEDSLDEYIQELVDVGREMKRVLRDDGSWWLNLGDKFASAPSGTSGKKDDSWERPSRDESKDARKQVGNDFRLKRKSKMLVPHRVAIALQDDGWVVRNDVTWCLAATTKVYARTQKREGPMMLKDIARLDPNTVELWDGKKWTQVVDFYENSAPESTHRLELRNGERIGCTGKHKWVTQDGEKTTQELEAGDVLRETELPEPKEGDVEKPIYLPDEEIGWLVGLYIAEGSRGKGGDQIQIAGHVDEVERYERVSEIAENFGATCEMYETEGNSATVNLHGEVVIGVMDQYVRGSDAKTKRLRPRSWMRSDTFLDAVLRGYLHGDGHYDEENDRWRLGFTRNDRLADDLRTICARLGYQIRLQRGEIDGHDVYRGEIRHERSEYPNAKHDTEIVEISDSPCRTFYDVEVADEPHLFALASGVLTHNSKPNPMPSSVKDRLNTTTEQIFHLTPEPDYYYDLDAIREPHKEASKKRIKTGLHQNHPEDSGVGISKTDTDEMGERFAHPAGKNPGDVFEVTTKPFPDAHFAVYPPELCEKPIKATAPPKVCAECGTPYERDVERVSIHRSDLPESDPRYRPTEYDTPTSEISMQKEGSFSSVKHLGWEQTCDCDTDETNPGIVLDPFAGAGTTCMVAQQLNRRWIGIDINPEYVDMSVERIEKETDVLFESALSW